MFDFDKTLTYNDSLTQLFLWRMRGWRIIFMPLYFTFKVSSKIGVISIKREKELSIKVLFSNDYLTFDSQCRLFAPKIKLTPCFSLLQEEINKGSQVIILSASPSNYLHHIFTNVTIVATTFCVNDQSEIIAIQQHPYGEEKLRCLLNIGVSHIDTMYYDSKSDEALIPICNEWFRVANGHVVARNIK